MAYLPPIIYFRGNLMFHKTSRQIVSPNTKSRGAGHLLLSASLAALLWGCGQQNASVDTPAARTQQAEAAVPQALDQQAPTQEEAAALIERVETFNREFGEYSARIQWAQATNITYDTNWLATKADTEGTEQGVKFANEAKRFNDLDLPPEMRRKLEAIKLGLNVPAPEKPGAAAALAEINTRMGSTYATGKIDLDGKPVARNDLEAMMGTVRDPERLKEIWTKWREVPIAKREDGGTMKSDYTAMAEIANEGARELGFATHQ